MNSQHIRHTRAGPHQPPLSLWLISLAVFVLVGCGSSDVTRAVGARCDNDTDCDDTCQDGDDYPGGFCTLSCDSSEGCPKGARCVDRDNGICLFGCIPTEPGSAANDCSFLGVGWRCETKNARDDGREVTVCVGDL